MLSRALAVALFATGLATAAETPAPPNRVNFTQTVEFVTRPEGDAPAVTRKASFEMVYVPGGEFAMGSPDGEPGREANEGPRHKVKVGAFWMGKCEVTWDEFDLFLADTRFPRADEQADRKVAADAITRPTTPYVDETYGHERQRHPVLSLTHHAAMTYCHWLRKQTGRAYRLPTEAEWEYAARSGTDSAYAFGADPKALGEYAWFKGNAADDDHPRGTTHKVGTKKANQFGLHDMYGNVAEWTLDQYDSKAYETRARNPLSLRPVAPPTDHRWSHVARGGSWADKAERCRSAARRVSDKSWQKWDPDEPPSVWWLTRMDVIGFRIVLAENEQPELAKIAPKVVKTSK